MNHCVLVYNLVTKEKIECYIKALDENTFMKKFSKYQQDGDIYVYEFTNKNMYFVIKKEDEIIIEPIRNKLAITILEQLNSTREERIQSITNSIKQIMKRYNVKCNFSSDNVKQSLEGLEADPSSEKIIQAKNYYLTNLDNTKVGEQKGGILIWLTEKYVIDSLPKSIAFIFRSIIEIIDWIFIIASSIPGLQFVAGAGVVIDIMSFIYSFLRFDLIGMVGSIISFIPFVGDILGGIIRAGGKMYRFFKGRKKRRRSRRRSRY